TPASPTRTSDGSATTDPFALPRSTSRVHPRPHRDERKLAYGCRRRGRSPRPRPGSCRIVSLTNDGVSGVDEHQQVTAGVREGDVLAGKYRIDKILGVGGMGVVVAAHHIHLDDRVAIKFLLPDALANRETVARFAREAQAAVKIKSEHVARVTDVGTLDNG